MAEVAPGLMMGFSEGGAIGRKANVMILWSCWIATHWLWLKNYPMRPIWMGYYGHEISFAVCWDTFHELTRLVWVVDWGFVAQKGSSVTKIPSMLIFVEMCMFALLVYFFQRWKLNEFRDVQFNGRF